MCEQREVVLRRLAEPDSGIDAQRVRSDARGTCRFESFDEKIADIVDDVVVARIVLHRARFALHVHRDETGARLTDDCEHSRIGAQTPDMEGRWLGLDEFLTAFREYLQALSDLRIEAERIIDLSGDRVLVLSRQTARGKQSGVPIEHEFGDVFTLRDGRVVRLESYWNRADAIRAAGLSE